MIKHCQLQTIYRLSRINKFIFRLTTNNLFWRDLIVRDFGIVPNFINNYKLYYLKELHYGVPLYLYQLVDDKAEKWKREVIYVDGELAVADNHLVRLFNRRKFSDRLELTGRTIKRIVFDRYYFPSGVSTTTYYLLFTDGRILDATNNSFVAPITFYSQDEPIADVHIQLIHVSGTLAKIPKLKIMVVLTKSGRVLIDDKPIATVEPMIKVVDRFLLSVSGKYYRWDEKGVSRTPSDYITETDYEKRQDLQRWDYERWTDRYFIVEGFQVINIGSTPNDHYFLGFEK